MLEPILIAVLAFLVAILATLLIIRTRRTRGAILLDEKAINELIRAVVENARAGKIPDIATRVSHILRHYLKCDRVAFLKINRNSLEMSHLAGVKDGSGVGDHISLTRELQDKLKTVSRVTPVSELRNIMPKEFLSQLEDIGFNYFFSVFLRNNLFGVYFISTGLPADNASLKFLTTALAFSLSAAYHIRKQDKQIKRYENRLKATAISDNNDASVSIISRNDLNRYLKIKNSRSLVSELIKTLSRDLDFSKAAFYVKPAENDKALISVNWQLTETSDRILRENYGQILNNINPGNAVEAEKVLVPPSAASAQGRNNPRGEIKYIASLPWIKNRRAVLAWHGERPIGEVDGRLRKFWREALPIIEHVSRYEEAEEMSYTDGLTGLYNFRYFKKRLGEEYQRAKRYGRSLALLILDVDDLKRINDNCGHQAGDELLKSLGRVLMDSIRAIDVISRYGGDEFCLILPETGRNRARLFMERIRNKITSIKLQIEGVSEAQQYTISIGAAVYPSDADTADELIRAADMSLLKAKEEGRNCSKLFEPGFSRKA